ncbi:MAG TPA: hypothetical protein VN647_08850, partial [Nitrospira sp.]|nr:hypothetical protein [Nitrospira sp.]
MKAIWGILLAALFLALPARADTLYTISGTASIHGNDACVGPCLETVDFSFNVTESLDPTYKEYFLTLTGASVTAQGSLGPFSKAPGITLDNGWYAPIYLGGSDLIFDSELDINFSGNFEARPFVPDVIAATLYSCGDQTCLTDFCPTDWVMCQETMFPIKGLWINANLTNVSVVDPVMTP